MSKEETQKPKQPPHKTHKKVFDITRPGQAPASPNSRSVIASTKPPVADDQFVPSAPVLRAGDPFEKRELLDAKNRKDLQPISAAIPSAADSAFTTAPIAGPDPSAFPASAPEIGSTESALPTPASPAPAASIPVDNDSTTNLDAVADAINNEKTSPELPVTEISDIPTSEPAEAPAVAESNTPEPAAPAAIAEEETPAHLALGQTVEAPKEVPIWEHPDTSEQVASTPPSRAAGQTEGQPSKTIEDLLAETDAPTLEPEKAPSLIVSHHNAHHVPWWEPVLVFVGILLLAAIALNFLLDAGIIRTTLSVPHTSLLN